MPTPQELEAAYYARREVLGQEWVAYTRQHGRTVLRPGDDPAHIRHSLFEAWVIGKIAELQVLAQEQTLAREPQQPEIVT